MQNHAFRKQFLGIAETAVRGGDKSRKTPAQVALRWLVQQPDIAVVPRALNEREIEENIAVFDFALSDEEMERIGALRDRNLRIVDPEVRRPVWDEG